MNDSANISDFVKPFDLGQAPLLRVGLVNLSPDRHLLLCDMHHIISDGISVSVLMREFTDLYEAASLRSSAYNIKILPYGKTNGCKVSI